MLLSCHIAAVHRRGPGEVGRDQAAIKAAVWACVSTNPVSFVMFKWLAKGEGMKDPCRGKIHAGGACLLCHLGPAFTATMLPCMHAMHRWPPLCSTPTTRPRTRLLIFCDASPCIAHAGTSRSGPIGAKPAATVAAHKVLESHSFPLFRAICTGALHCTAAPRRRLRPGPTPSWAARCSPAGEWGSCC